jgi:hypothetical protein
MIFLGFCLFLCCFLSILFRVVSLSQKCYKLFSEPLLSYYEADHYCNYDYSRVTGNDGSHGSGSGSFDHHLVHIGDSRESDMIYRLCRGSNIQNTNTSSTSSVVDPVDSEGKGCWIGLHNPSGNGLFNWIDSRSLGKADQTSIYYDWAKGEPNNLTISSAFPNTQGERCVSVNPWINNPLLQEEGGWNDAGCQLKKSFVCQLFSSIEYYTLTIQGNNNSWKKGMIQGGRIEVKGSLEIDDFSLSSSSSLSLLADTKILSSLTLTDNVHIDVFNKLEVGNGGGAIWIGEQEIAGAQSVITFYPSSSGYFGSLKKGISSEITIQNRVKSQGNLNVRLNTKVAFVEVSFLYDVDFLLF